MKVLLFGKDGQVGSAVLEALPPAWEIVALGRAEADFAQPGAAAAAVEGARADVVINAAAWTAVDEAETEHRQALRLNAAAVGELSQAMADGWLIHYSTDYVFDGESLSSYTEDDVPNPVNAYGRSKLAGEAAIAASGRRHLIFRTSWVHAPRRRNFATTILRLAAERDVLRVVDDQVGAPTSAALIASVTLRALELIASGAPPPSGLFHLAAAGSTSWHGYAREVVATALAGGAALKLDPSRILPVSSADYPQAARRPLNSRLATNKLEAALGLTLPDWREAVRDTVRQSLPEVVR